MKKITLFGCLLAAVQLSALAKTSDNVGGILRVDSAAVETLVSVPWVGYGADGNGKINVARLVKTINLEPGDTVMAVKANGVYEAWTLGEERTWEPVLTVSKDVATQRLSPASAAEERQLDRGAGLWVIRGGEDRDLAKPFYLAGQYEASAVATTIAGGTKAAPAWTLLVNPNGEATDLNAVDWQGRPLADDQIAIAGPGGLPQYYSWKNGAWSTSTYVVDEATGLKRQVRSTTAVVPVGSGFWYVRKGAAFAFNW